MEPNKNNSDTTAARLQNNLQSTKVAGKCKRFFTTLPPKRRLAIVAGVSLGVLIVGVFAIQALKPEVKKPDPVPDIEFVPFPVEPTTVPSRLTGVQVDPALDARAVTAVMIENSIDARPQSGLSEAGVVFEAIAEGGITRFLALYQTEQPTHIGPIRSARPYYVRWARGFDAAYVHSGGSPEALALLRSIGVKDMDHGNHPGTFDRVTNRFAPHNVYTSMARLDALRESLGFAASEFSGFERLEEAEDEPAAAEETPAAEDGTPAAPATPAEQTAANITFNISSARYNTSYTYDPATNTYGRVMGGAPHTNEGSGEQVRPSVVIAMETTYGIHPNGIHSVYGSVGSGAATIFQNGGVITGTWSKPSDTAELKFLQADGQPLLLQPGQTWITAIPAGKYTFN